MKQLLLAILLLPNVTVAQTVRVDKFNLKTEMDGDVLILSLDTDLPDAAQVSVTVYRTYLRHNDTEEYLREYYSKNEAATHWQTPRRIRLDSQKWEADLVAFQDKMAGVDAAAAFEIRQISRNVVAYATVVFQKRFGGIGNPNLAGPAVRREDGWNDVSAELQIPMPLQGTPVPRKSKRVAWDALEVGKSYRVSKQIPILPQGDGPSRVPEGSVIRVVGTREENGYPWYDVILQPDGRSDVGGWIRGIALMHQDIRQVEDPR